MAKKKPATSDLVTMTPKSIHRYFFPRICSILLVGTLLSGGLSPLFSQEAGVAYVAANSDHPVLFNTTGYGLFASVPLFEWLHAKLSFDKISKDLRADGEVCVRYAPNLSCRIETVHTESSMGTIRLSFLPTVNLGKILDVGAGGGVSFSSLDASSLGESGRIANLEVPNTGQLGYQATASMSFAPFASVPLSVVGAATAFWVDFKACVTYEEVYDPFCGKTRFDEFSAGLAYHF